MSAVVDAGVAVFFVAVLAVISVVDVKQRIVPNRIVLPAAAVVLAARMIVHPSVVWIVAGIVVSARGLDSRDRLALRASLAGDDCYTLAGFAMRRAAEGLRQGSLSLALQAVEAGRWASRSHRSSRSAASSPSSPARRSADAASTERGSS